MFCRSPIDRRPSSMRQPSPTSNTLQNPLTAVDHHCQVRLNPWAALGSESLCMKHDGQKKRLHPVLGFSKCSCGQRKGRRAVTIQFLLYPAICCMLFVVANGHVVVAWAAHLDHLGTRTLCGLLRALSRCHTQYGLIFPHRPNTNITTGNLQVKLGSTDRQTAKTIH